MTQQEAKETFKRSGLASKALFAIWKQADTGGLGYLDKSEFILVVHLIAMAKKGIPIAKHIHKRYEKFLKEYKKKLPGK